MKDWYKAGDFRTWDNAKHEIGLDYCELDVSETAALLEKMLPYIDLPRALFRGRCMAAVSAAFQNGIPFDIQLFVALCGNWPSIQKYLILEIDVDDGIYVEKKGKISFNMKNFGKFLRKNKIPWPKTDAGRYATDADTFGKMIDAYPDTSHIHKALKDIQKMRSYSLLNIADFSVGKDGRNRADLKPFRSATSRSQPSSKKLNLRGYAGTEGLMQASTAWALVYMDYSAAEVGIAAALSGDPLMMEDYRTGDPHLALGVAAGIVPVGAKKETHPDEREMLKPCSLGMLYGMRPPTLANRIAGFTPYPERTAWKIWKTHKSRYTVFWKWMGKNLAHFHSSGEVHTVFGWPLWKRVTLIRYPSATIPYKVIVPRYLY